MLELVKLKWHPGPGSDREGAMRDQITRAVTEVINDPKARHAARRAAEHAAKEFLKKFREEYRGIIDEERKKR